MSDYHILETGKKDNFSKVAFHISVPDEDNDVPQNPVNLRDAVKQYMEEKWAGDVEPVTRIPWLEADFPAEYASIQNGEIMEIVEIVYYSANYTLMEKRDEIDSRYNVLAAAVPNLVRARFRFWGYSRDVS